MAKQKDQSMIFSGGESDNLFMSDIQKQSRIVPVEKDSKQVQDGNETDYISPPYTFETLTSLYELNTYHARCIQLIAALTCMLGYSLVTDDENKDEDETHKAIKEWLDNHSQYAEQSFLKTLYNFQIDRGIFANSFLEVARNAKGEVAEFYHLPARYCKLKKLSKKEIVCVQQIQADVATFEKFGQRKDKEKNEYIQLKNYSPRSRYYGVPDYIAGLAAMVLDRSASEYNIRNFDNNLMLSLIISVIGADLSSETKKNIKEYLTNNGKGVANAGKVLLLIMDEADKNRVEFKTDKVSAEVRDASFRNLRNDAKEEIIAAHGVPPRLVGVMSAGQLGGGGEAKEQMRMFRDMVIGPRQMELEDLINRLILPGAFPKNKKWKIKFESFDIEDAAADATFFKTIMEIVDSEGERVLDSAEIREELGYPARKAETPNDKKNGKSKEKDKSKGQELVDDLVTLRKRIVKSINEHGEN